jgi:hypothetical protein
MLTSYQSITSLLPMISNSAAPVRGGSSVRLYAADNPTVTGTYTTSTYSASSQTYKLYKFTTNGTFTPSADVSLGYVIIGGSGGGGGTSNSSNGFGSAGNGSNITYSNVNDNTTTYCRAGDTITITLGAAGKSWNTNGHIVNGTAGTATTVAGSFLHPTLLGGTITASGGNGGQGSITSTPTTLTTTANSADSNPSPANNVTGKTGGNGGSTSATNTDGLLVMLSQSTSSVAATDGTPLEVVVILMLRMVNLPHTQRRSMVPKVLTQRHLVMLIRSTMVALVERVALVAMVGVQKALKVTLS